MDGKAAVDLDAKGTKGFQLLLLYDHLKNLNPTYNVTNADCVGLASHVVGCHCSAQSWHS